MKNVVFCLSLVVAAASGCYADYNGSDADGGASGVGAKDGGASTGSGGGGASSNPSGGSGGGGGASTIDPTAPLWCQCKALMQQRCDSCHGATPSGGAPMALVTTADLMAPSKSDPSKNAAEQSLARMQSASAPMPPSPMAHATPTEIGVLDAWIKAGYPSDPCTGFDAGPAATNPYNTPLVCTSGKTYAGQEGSTMRPGEACNACHQSRGGEAPIFAIAGTVYPTAHEPNDCVGVAAGSVSVVITDANGTPHTLSVNSSGNFTLQSAIALPYTAKVVKGGVERKMVASQTSGDCNSCHTVNGASSAPGRIMSP